MERLIRKFEMSVQAGDLNTVRVTLQSARQVLSPEEFATLLNFKDCDFPMTALHRAARDGNRDIVVELFGYPDAIDVNAQLTSGFTALHLASLNNHVEVVEQLLSHPHIELLNIRSSQLSSIIQWFDRSHLQQLTKIRGPAEKSPFLYPELYDQNVTALHCAALMGHAEIVEAFLQKVGSSKLQAMRTLNAVDDQLMTPLHYAIIGGDAATVAELLSNSTLTANLVELRNNLTPLKMAYILMSQAHDDHKAIHELSVMISMLLERPDVKALQESQDRDRQVFVRDRQVFVDAANAILVGAALIASITFTGWLQPPLGFQPYFETKYLVTGLAPPETYQSFAAVKQHWVLQVFWIFNSLSFFLAIATVLIGASAMLPSQEIIGKAEVEHIRTLLIRASMVLSFSVFFVLGAFMAGGFACLPPSLNYPWGMLATSGVGGSMCIIMGYYFYRRLFRLFGNVPGGFKGKMSHVLHELFAHDSRGAFHTSVFLNYHREGNRGS